MSDIGVLVHNACPNPNGKKGGAAHQAKIQEIGQDLIDRGYSVDFEHRVLTPGGKKSSRFIDIYATKGNDTIAIQVGRMTKGGLPVSRERQALADLLEYGFGAVFVRYN